MISIIHSQGFFESSFQSLYFRFLGSGNQYISDPRAWLRLFQRKSKNLFSSPHVFFHQKVCKLCVPMVRSLFQCIYWIFESGNKFLSIFIDFPETWWLLEKNLFINFRLQISRLHNHFAQGEVFLAGNDKNSLKLSCLLVGANVSIYSFLFICILRPLIEPDNFISGHFSQFFQQGNLSINIELCVGSEIKF